MLLGVLGLDPSPGWSWDAPAPPVFSARPLAWLQGVPVGDMGSSYPSLLSLFAQGSGHAETLVPAKTMEGCWDPTRLWTPAPQSLKVPKLACITKRQFGGWKRINRPRSQSQKAHLRRKPRFPELWLKLSDGASIKSEWKSPMSPFCFPSMGKCKLLPSPL